MLRSAIVLIKVRQQRGKNIPLQFGHFSGWGNSCRGQRDRDEGHCVPAGAVGRRMRQFDSEKRSLKISVRDSYGSSVKMAPVTIQPLRIPTNPSAEAGANIAATVIQLYTRHGGLFDRQADRTRRGSSRSEPGRGRYPDIR